MIFKYPGNSLNGEVSAYILSRINRRRKGSNWRKTKIYTFVYCLEMSKVFFLKKCGGFQLVLVQTKKINPVKWMRMGNIFAFQSRSWLPNSSFTYPVAQSLSHAVRRRWKTGSSQDGKKLLFYRNLKFLVYISMHFCGWFSFKFIQSRSFCSREGT